LFSAEKKTVVNVLILYFVSSFLILSSFIYIYYDFQKQSIEKEEQQVMREYAKEVFWRLQDIHTSLKNNSQYPRYNKFNSAIFDNKKNLLFSNITNNIQNLDTNFFKKNGYSYYVYEMTPYYMGSAYIVIEKKSTDILQNISTSIIAIVVFIILIIFFTSVFLTKIILKPLRENVKLLDRFIKDTTHELNTPISTIMTNMELLENIDLDSKASRKLSRIKTASITISNIYEDLVFLMLTNKTKSNNQSLNINNIIKERLEYFETFFITKKLTLNIEEKDLLITDIDEKKIIRVIDNLISNALKYTNKSTTIKVIITKNSFSICDEGDGMSEDEISKIFERYTRFNNTQGGFGIGYNIIHTIAKEYDIDIKIDSKVDEGTCVTLVF
jgi:two-component system OmpR family sensor kinase